jgi:tetratricopeptide (TPR) repeat protein/sulfur relay (sulfurtransferase) DsrC/TusE family protein
MFFLNLSFFNTIRGPQILCYFPDSLEEEKAQQIANLLNISELIKQKFFVYETSSKFKTVNYYFEVPSEWARGKKEMLLISVILTDEQIEQIHMFEDLLKKISTSIAEIENAYKGFYMYDASNEDYEEIERVNELICTKVGSFLEETKETLKKAQEISLDRVMETFEKKKVGSYIVDANFFDFLYQIEKNESPFIYLNEIIKYGIPIFITEQTLLDIKIPEEILSKLFKNIRVFHVTSRIINKIKMEISKGLWLKNSSLSLIGLARSLSKDKTYEPITIVSDDFKLIQFVQDYFKDLKILPSSSFILELINNLKDKQIRNYFNKIRKKIINIEMQQALEQQDTHPSAQLSWLMEKAINVASSSFTTPLELSKEVSELPQVELSLINLYTKGHKLKEPQLKPIQDLLPFLDDIKLANQNLNEVQKHFAKDEMEIASAIIHPTLDTLISSFLLAAAVLTDPRILQFQVYLAKMIANFEFLAAICHTDLNELNHAIEHFDQSAIYSTLANKATNTVIASYLKSLSLIYSNQIDRALLHFELTKKLSEHYKLPRQYVLSLGGISIAKFLKGEVEEARATMDQVNKLIENDENEALLVMNEFGDNFYMMGRPDIAMHLYNEGFDIAIKKQSTIATSIYSKIKRCYYATGSFDNAPLISYLQKILDVAYNGNNKDEVELYEQAMTQLSQINVTLNDPLPFKLESKVIQGKILPEVLKGWMDLLHIMREEKILDGGQKIQFTNFFCYKPGLGNLILKIPEQLSLRFERVPEAYKLALNTNEVNYSIFEPSADDKQKYLIRIIIVTKSMANITLKRGAPQIFGKFLEL